MNCPKCGADNPEEAAYCSLCHADFGPQPVIQQPYGAPPGPPPAQPLPPGAFQQPGGGMAPPGPFPPPGAGTLQPPQPIKTVNPTLTWAIRVVVVVLYFALGWYGMAWVLTRPRTFNSTTSGITFTYPGKWKKVVGSGFGITAAASTGGQMTAEIELADGNSETSANYYLAVGSIKGMTVDFETFKSRLRQADTASLAAAMPAGATVTGLTFSDTTVGSAPAFSVKYTASFSGNTFDCDLTFAQRGSTLYLLGFRAKKPKGTSDTFQELLKTVKFKAR
jgi:hypothetical protein